MKGEQILRKTKQKDIILSILEKSDRPLTAKEIHQLSLKKHSQIGIATVYRMIQQLHDSSIITQIVLQGLTPHYELVTKEHHHHFYCRDCGVLFDVSACPGNIQKLCPGGFLIENHEITLYGLCSKCR